MGMRCVTQISYQICFTFALDRFELEGRKLTKRLGAVAYTAFPERQVTLPSSARQRQDVMPLSPTTGVQAPRQLYAHIAPRGPLCTGGQSQIREAQKRSENIPNK